MKNHVSPPVLTTALPVPLARAHVSYVQWIVLGEHALPVRSDDAADETMNALPLSRVIWLTASATPELGTSMIMSTFSASYHWRAICEPTSALFWWSAKMSSTFNPLAPAGLATRIRMPMSAAMRAVVMRFAPLWPPCAPTAALYPEVVVQLGHAGVQLCVRNHVHHAAVLHHVVTVGDRGGEAKVLLDEQDGEPFALEPPERGADLLDDDRGQAFGRLVEQQEPGAR